MAVTLMEPPEPVGHFKRQRSLGNIGAHAHRGAVVGSVQALRLFVLPDPRQRPAEAVVGSNKMKHEVGIVSALKHGLVALR